MVRRVSLLMVVAGAAVIVGLPTAAAGGMCHPGGGQKMTTSSETRVHIADCAFGTTVSYIEPGDEISWTNKDVYPHSVTGAAGSWGDEELLEQGTEVSHTFDEEGVYPYYCVLHPTMVGAVVVGDPMKTSGLAPISARPEAPDAGVRVPWVALIAIALALVAWRTLALRRRAASGTPAP